MSEAERRATTYSDPDDVRGPLWEEAVAAGGARGALVPAGDGDADDEPLAPDDARGNLRRYAPWQWRDFWRNRGSWMALGALLGVWLLVFLAGHGSYSRAADGSAVHGPMTPEGVRGMAHAFFTLGGVLAALLGVGGVVSRERERGQQRFLFAKPVRPVQYYLQAFAINSASSLVVLFGAVLLAAVVLGSVVPVGTVAAVGAVAYLVTAGITFFASTLIRFDAPFAAAWLAAGFAAASAADQGWRIARPLAWLFPQGPAAAVFNAVTHSSVGWYTDRIPLALTLAILVVVLYGALAFAAGVAVLRRRSIST